MATPYSLVPFDTDWRYKPLDHSEIGRRRYSAGSSPEKIDGDGGGSGGGLGGGFGEGRVLDDVQQVMTIAEMSSVSSSELLNGG
jgi:hypothetical protein